MHPGLLLTPLMLVTVTGLMRVTVVFTEVHTDKVLTDTVDTPD